jgi:hypothetical protein
MILVQPIIMGESVEKFGILEDESSIGSGTTGQTTHASIDMSGCRDLDITDGKTECGKDFPNRHPLTNRLHSLRCAYCTDLLILETGENIRKKGRGPDGVVVGEDDNIGCDSFDARNHLKTLVGIWDGQDPYFLRIDCIGKLLKRT